jgi:hypothetical protein
MVTGIRIPCFDEDVVLADSLINVARIVSHPLFQRLRFIKQLGQTFLVFPGGIHTRFEHALGVFALTKRQCQDWIRRGLITKDEARILCVFALLHDIGHFPFSHAFEPLMGKGHHEIGIEYVEEMSDEIRSCGVDPQMIIKAMRGQYPLAEAVTHGILGTDKLNYSLIDPYHTGFGGAPEIIRILSCTQPYNGRIVVEKRAASECLRLVEFMATLYGRIYERSKCVYARRLLQKMLERAFDAPERPVAEAWRWIGKMTDSDFEGLCAGSLDPQQRYLVETYRGGRPLPWTGILICQKGFGDWHARSDKILRRVIEISPEEFDKLDRLVNWRSAHVLEQKIAETTGTSCASIFVQPSKPRRRYTLPATTVLDGEGTQQLSAIVATESIDREAERIRIIRVGTGYMEALKTIHDRSDDVLKILMT